MKKSRDKDAASGQLWGWLFGTRMGLPSLELKKHEIIVGTATDCDLVIPKDVFGDLDANDIESYHFKIMKRDEQIILEDMSRKGTFIDESLVGKGKKKDLAHNSKIACFGKKLTVLVFMDKKTCDMCNYPPAIKDKYAVSYFLGSGGFGDVCAIFNKKTHKGYAMKVIPVDPVEEKYVKWEVKILRGLKHPCIISMEDAVFDLKELYIILELMEGGDLAHWLQPELRLTEKQTKLIFYQLTLAVEYIHSKGICHRDLKPENILLRERKPETLIKVTDFGVSKNECLQSAMDTKIGTPYYMAPETISAKARGKTYTNQVDIWSMGVILFYCLSGSLPFRDAHAILRGQYRITKPPEIWVKISLTAQELMDSMLIQDPNRRINLKHILGHRWFQDKEMVEVADKLLERNKPRRWRKTSVPSEATATKTPETKVQIPDEKRRFSWNIPHIFPLSTPQKAEKKGQPPASPKNEAKIERPIAQPRGVLQFLKRDKDKIAPENKPQRFQNANIQFKEPAYGAKEVPKKSELSHKKEPAGVKKPPVMEYRSPEYKPPKKTENTLLVNAKKNLKPVKK